MAEDDDDLYVPDDVEDEREERTLEDALLLDEREVGTLPP